MISLPSLPKLPTRLPGISLAPAAVLNGLSLIAKALPGLNPPRAIYAVVNVETGVPLTVPHSWVEITPQFSTYQLTDYPVEDGGFLMANKVRRPDQLRVTMTQTGSDVARATWLEAIRQQQATDPLARYHIITPQGIYQYMTLVGLSYQTRSDRGSNLLYLDLEFTEVPQIEVPSLVGANAVEPESGGTLEVGRIFSQTATTQIAQRLGPIPGIGG